MKYTVEFYRDAFVTEYITAIVEAESKDDIEAKLKDGDFDATDHIESDYSGDNDSIRDIKIFEE